MDEKIEAFRAEVLRWRGSRRKGARPYTAEMKAKALQLAKDLQSQGLAMDVVAKRIGICAATVYLWRSSSKGSRMVPVTVVRTEPQVVASASFALVSPRGYRLEGLPVKLAMAMLQELG
jgi:transposase-like protein